jgi:hypothetical protein
MKKLITWKTPSFITYLVLILVVLLYTFKSDIMPYFFRIKFKSPVEFHNVKITFPKGIIYNAGKRSIVLYHWEDPDAFLYLGEMNPEKMKKESLIQFFKKKNFHILETKDISFFKGYPGFTISYVDASWKYNKDIYIIPKNLCINYQGTKENYKSFKDIIDSMEFLDENQQSKR